MGVEFFVKNALAYSGRALTALGGCIKWHTGEQPLDNESVILSKKNCGKKKKKIGSESFEKKISFNRKI